MSQLKKTVGTLETPVAPDTSILRRQRRGGKARGWQEEEMEWDHPMRLASRAASNAVRGAMESSETDSCGA